ncbi:MAG: YeeE/YedE family protein [Proteobacteria bacterium]|nr:YeeE/YedE family protein [Pseudomonadota bacterium]
MQAGPLCSAAAICALLIAAVWGQGPRMVLLATIGILLGITLFHSSFGFASAYRRLLEGRGVRAVQAQILMLAAATLLFTPVLAQGEFFGREVVGAIAPAGIPVALGAFLFGIGMQLAGGCGSGTLYAAGAGQGRMVLVLGAFCAGAFWASLHMGLWERLPAFEPMALGDALGWPIAVVLQLALFGVLHGLLGRLPGAGADASPRIAASLQRVWRGPWTPEVGALVLAGLAFLTLIVAGHPWSITWAFTLWGAKAAVALGWEPGASEFWAAAFQRESLESGVLSDVTSVMDIGILAGAFLAAGWAGGFRPRLGPTPRAVLVAMLGGVAMGYGARIAFGCNVGAFFSGIASTSLHGWLWIASALPGSWVGLKLHARLAIR